VNQLKLGSRVPSWVIARTLNLILGVTFRIQQYFQMLRALDDYDVEDGIALGDLFMIKTRAETSRASDETFADVRVRTLVASYGGLREIAALHPFFEPMMKQVVYNRLRPVSEVSTRLCNLTISQGNVMGDAFALSLATNVTSDVAVYEWIARYPALSEIDYEYVWFRPMMVIIGTRLLEKAAWGVALRVFVGAGLSLVDMISDIAVISMYLTNQNFDEEQSIGYGLLAMIVMNLSTQWISVLFNHRKNRKDLAFETVRGRAKRAFSFTRRSKPHEFDHQPKRVLFTRAPLPSTQASALNPHLRSLRSQVVVFTGMKPVFDAYRMCVSKEQKEGQLLEPTIDLTITKVIELFFEAIPGTILQSFAYLQFMMDPNKKRNEGMKRALMSIILSAATSGFTAGCITYDLDTNVNNRKNVFYGIIPDKASSRSVLFVCLIMNSFLFLLVKSTTIVLLLELDSRQGSFYFSTYMGCDLGLYFFIKAVRGDFWYWLDVGNWGVDVALSVLIRLVVKIVVDFTGAVHFRHPLEFGGLHWSFNLLLSLAAMLGTVALWLSDANELSTNGGFVCEPCSDSTKNFVCADFGTLWSSPSCKSLERPLPEDAHYWMVALGLTGAWIGWFGVFLWFSSRKHRHTFWDRRTGRAFVCALFMSDSDDVKCKVIGNSERIWRPIRASVQMWCLENWWRWEEETPVWFTDVWKSSVPADFIPSEALAGLLKEGTRSGGGGRGSRRTGSVLGSIKKLSVVAVGGARYGSVSANANANAKGRRAEGVSMGRKGLEVDKSSREKRSSKVAVDGDGGLEAIKRNAEMERLSVRMSQRERPRAASILEVEGE